MAKIIALCMPGELMRRYEKILMFSHIFSAFSYFLTLTHITSEKIKEDMRRHEKSEKE
jgi:hypothetical protein